MRKFSKYATLVHRAKHYLLITVGVGAVIGVVALQQPAEIHAADPGGVTGVRMWYQADSAGNTNAQWNDISGQGHNLTQGTAANQPVLTTNQINFNPAYVFDGTDDGFDMPTQGVGGSEPMSAFFAAKSTNAGGGWRYFNEFGDDTPSIGFDNGKPQLYVRTTSPIEHTFSDNAVGAPHVFSYISPNADNQDRVVGVDDNEQTQNVTSGTYTTNSGRSDASFGTTNGSSGTTWPGPIAEAIYFNKVLSPQERLRVVSYLFIKNGVTRHQGTSGAGYADSGGATIWSADSTYKNDIAGIGRDDASTLNQKQSKSVNDDSLVAIGLGDIAATNQDNSNTFGADRSFLLWGNDDASTTSTTTVDGTYVRMERTWKAGVINNVGQVKVQIPTSVITTGGTPTMYVSDDTTFDGSDQQITMTTNGGNYEADVTFATGTQYFSFGSFTGSDLEFVSKTATDISGNAIASYTPGQPLEYHLTVQNNGPEDSGTVTVTDTLPSGIVPTTGGATGNGWTCNVAGQTATCTRSTLASGATAPEILIEATIASNVTGQKDNTASVSVSNDPDPSNNSANLLLDASPVADLSITKAHTGSPTAGNPLTYDFTVTNNGPSDVSEFTVTDNFDPNLTFSSSTAQVNCTGAQNVTCTSVAPLPAGDARNFSITVDVDGGFGGGNIANTATVAPPAGTNDPNSGNDSATDDTDVNVSTDLSVDKSHTGNFTAGVNNDFTINVTNNGPSDAPANSITVTDTLDEDFSYVSATGTSWSCNHSGGTVTCTYTAALTGTPTTTPDITLTVGVNPIAKPSTTNTAAVSGTTPDPTPGNNSDDDPVTIESEADLAITKAAVNDPFTPGQNEQFTFSVTNNGPSVDAPTYSITDTLPTGLTYVSYTGAADCSMSSGANVSCTGGGIGVGEPAQVTTITVAVDPGASGSVDNTATVAPDPSVNDPVPGNDSSTITINFEPNADLSITKTAPGSMTAGNNADYTLTTTNGGPSNVSSYTVTDELDPNLSYQSSNPNVCTVTGTTSQGGDEITCTGNAITGDGSQEAITVTVAVEPTATSGSTISNLAVVAPPAGTNDPTPGNNTSSTVNNTVATEADLSVTKSHTGNFTVGGSGSFTIEVTNNGPSDAQTFSMTDVLPDGFTYVNATNTNGACNNSGQTVTCTVSPALPSGQTATITLDVSVDGDVTANSIDNTASATSATTDPTPGNNSDTDTVTIDSATADLTATKTAQGSPTAGQPVTYRFEVTNNGGPDNAGEVQIQDNLPSYLSYQSFNSVSGGTWDCGGSSGQNVTCTLPVLNVNDTAVVDVTVLIAQDAPDNADNNATVTFNGTDPSPVSLNTSDPVSHEADLEVTITHEQKTYHSGETINVTYTVTNHGPSAAKDAVLTGTIPDGVTITNVSATEPGGDSILAALDRFFLPRVHAADNPFSCSMSGQQLTCNAATLATGAYPLYLTGQIASGFTGQLTFTGQISSATIDPNGATATATDVITGVTLAGTGTNMLGWAAGAAAALVIGAGLFIRLRRRPRPEGTNDAS